MLTTNEKHHEGNAVLVPITAIATKEIRFFVREENRDMVIPVGAYLLLDENESIAYYDGYHFDIDPEEWEALKH